MNNTESIIAFIGRIPFATQQGEKPTKLRWHIGHRVTARLGPKSRSIKLSNDGPWLNIPATQKNNCTVIRYNIAWFTSSVRYPTSTFL